MRKPVFAICEQQRHRSAYASAQRICYVVALKFQQKAYECAPSEDSDQPGHPPSLIRVFAVRSMGS